MGKSVRKTHEEYMQELAIKNPNIEPLETYITGHTKILHRCKKCGHAWLKGPVYILGGAGCPECAKVHYTTEDYKRRVAEINNNIIIMGEYIGVKTKIQYKCKVCGYIGESRPDYFTSGRGCPCCAGKKIGPAPEYKNSIWASEYKTFYSKYLTEEQMKNNMPFSTKSITMKCCDCGREKTSTFENFTKSGFACICRDRTSFPNKFVFNVLCQLGLEVETEYTPKWSHCKQYDDYIEDYHLIIENHGLQHYEECSFTSRTLEEEQNNDKFKQILALENGIENYIVLDCRKSESKWIKQSIMSSMLPELLGFTENDVDWKMAVNFAMSSDTKYIADLFNDGYNITEISKILNKSVSSIIVALKRATTVGLCNYQKRTPIQIYCIELNMVFDNVNVAAKYLGKKAASSIWGNLKGIQKYAYHHPKTGEPLHWLYFSDALLQGYISE